jgi:peptidoglycan/xylan/chitin deacetylase (PgdA/CDA1 family)
VRKSIRVIGAALDAVSRPAGLVVLTYHRIDDGGGGLAVSAADFRAHLSWIEMLGLPVTGDLGPPYPKPGEPPRIALTFDDGYRSVADFAWPALRSRGWPATIYVVARALDDPSPFEWDVGVGDGRAALIDRGLLRELAEDGIGIGSHTLTHRYLPNLPPEEARVEIVDSRRHLEDFLGQDVRSFSYPMGGWNRAIRALVLEAGYDTAVTSDRGGNCAGQDSFVLRRQPAEPDLDTFARTLKGAFDFLRPLDRWKDRRRRTIHR